LHIGDETQRAAADELRAMLARQRLGEVPLLAPGVQLVTTQANTGVLRCFRVDECRDEAQRLLDLVNSLLASPKLRLQDLSKQYGADTRLRPHSYELWFGHEALVLQTAPARAK
jgi:hypothetical protein